MVMYVALLKYLDMCVLKCFNGTVCTDIMYNVWSQYSGSGVTLPDMATTIACHCQLCLNPHHVVELWHKGLHSWCGECVSLTCVCVCVCVCRCWRSCSSSYDMLPQIILERDCLLAASKTLFWSLILFVSVCVYVCVYVCVCMCVTINMY